MKPQFDVMIIGGGLAGTEAAWQLGKRGFCVALYEMRPRQMTAAHRSGDLAELVCSNSFRAANLENAVGLLKEEMRHLDSLIMAAADATRVPAGGGLAVDRSDFSRYIEDKLSALETVHILRERVDHIPGEGYVIIATGPLTDGGLAAEIAALAGNDKLYFYDAVAPVIYKDSIGFEKAFYASRYDKGAADYINCPLDEETYRAFYEALVTAETYPGKPFEKLRFFEGCMPIEEMARRGRDTLVYGPMKPVGLVDPRREVMPYGVVQLRQDDAAATLYNMVGFQTHLCRHEQERVFRMIPGLEKAEFARYGMMHRNTYINAPQCLHATMETKFRPGLFFAGQITGVEGYVESAANGLLAGLNCGLRLAGREPLVFPAVTGIGAQAQYITMADPRYFQPMNVNFGLFPPLEQKVRKKKEKNALLAARSLVSIDLLKAGLE